MNHLKFAFRQLLKNPGFTTRALDIEQITHVLHTHTHGDHAGGAYLWRALGAQMVGPKPAAFTLTWFTWLMPMLTDYGIYPPRPLDRPLPLLRAGDETDFEVSGLKFHALFVPGHSFDLTVYTTDLGGKRVAFTGDLGFENQDILHRCWGDTNKARVVVQIVRDKLLPWRPEVVFTGHGVRTNGMEFLAQLVRQTEQSLGLPAPGRGQTGDSARGRRRHAVHAGELTPMLDVCNPASAPAPSRCSPGPARNWSTRQPVVCQSDRTALPSRANTGTASEPRPCSSVRRCLPRAPSRLRRSG